MLKVYLIAKNRIVCWVAPSRPPGPTSHQSYMIHLVFFIQRSHFFAFVAFFWCEVALCCHFRWHYLDFNASILFEIKSHNRPMPSDDPIPVPTGSTLPPTY